MATLPVDYLLSTSANNNTTTKNTVISTTASNENADMSMNAPLSPTEVVEVDHIDRGDVLDRMYTQKVKQAIFVKKVTPVHVSTTITILASVLLITTYCTSNRGLT